MDGPIPEDVQKSVGGVRGLEGEEEGGAHFSQAPTLVQCQPPSVNVGFWGADANEV